MPRISAILPTFNREKVLALSIDSVLTQTFQDWELIVVDDRSTDGTEALVRAYADPRIRYVANTGRRGSAGARNFGISLAQAPVLAFHDAGDEWLPRKLETQLSALDGLPPAVGVVYSPMIWLYWDGSKKDLVPPVFSAEESGTWRRALGRGVGGVYLQAALVRRAAFDAVGGFDEDLNRWVDLDFFMRVARDFRFQFVPGPVAVYHEMEGGISNNADAMLDAYCKIMRKFEKDFGGDPDLLAPHQRAVARGLAPTRHSAFARRVLLDLIRSGRALPVDWVWLVVTVGGKPLHDALRTVRAALRRLS